MPKAVREVKAFNLGVVTAADDNDIKIDAATYSQDIDPNSTQGRLQGRWDDVMIDTATFSTTFQFIDPPPTPQVQREIDIRWTYNTQQEFTNEIYQNLIVRGEVTLHGTAPTSNVVVRVAIDDYANMSTYLKVHTSSDGAIAPNEGEYVDLTFTPSNYQTAQLVYLRPQNVTVAASQAIQIDVTAQSTEANWNVTDLDFSRNFNYVSNIIDGFIVKNSSFDTQTPKGLQGGAKIEIKLTSNPNFENDSSTIDITFASQDTNVLKAHKPDGGGAVNTKTLSFNNTNWNTYQALEPFAVDDGVKEGNKQVPLLVTANSNGHWAFSEIDSNISNRVRFDNGNFQTNSFPYAGQSLYNIVIVDTGGNTDNSGSGNSGDNGTDGWTKP